MSLYDLLVRSKLTFIGKGRNPRNMIEKISRTRKEKREKINVHFLNI